MEAIHHSVPEISADTEIWKQIIGAPYPIKLNIVRFLNVRQLFIAHHFCSSLRPAIENPSQLYKKMNLLCEVDVKKNSLIVHEILKIGEPDETTKELYTMRVFPEMQQNNKRMLRFGSNVSGTDFVFCKDAKQGVINILNRMWTIWPSSRLQLVVRGKVPKEYLQCSAFRETSSLNITSKHLFEDMELICLYARKIKYLEINATLPDNFNPRTVLNIEDVLFRLNAHWLKVSHLILHIPAKKAYFAETNLDSRDCNTIIRYYQQKTLSFIEIRIMLNSEVDIGTVLEDTVFLRVNHSGEQDEEIEVDKKDGGKEEDDDDGDESEEEDCYVCYYILTRSCEKEKWKLLRATILDHRLEEEEDDGIDKMLHLEVVSTSFFPRTFEVLICLNEKKETEAEIQRLTVEIDLATVDLEAYGGTESQCKEAKEFKQLLAEHNKEKRKLMEKLETIEKDLSAPDMEFGNDVYRLSRPR